MNAQAQPEPLTVRLFCGDALDVMRGMDAESVDAIVTDPPYGLSFMGKDWDHGIPGEAFWREALRVAKPGAHLLAFGGTRTFHRLTCAIEDAGWEIRDCVMWVYGSGFPKSLDVSKAIDKAAGVELETVGESVRRGDKRPYPRPRINGGKFFQSDQESEIVLTKAATSIAARQWQGWGTALKPAWEPIILARKPLVGTVAANVQRYGTGALNIDGCRVETDWSERPESWKRSGHGAKPTTSMFGSGGTGIDTSRGRWPANLIHDGSEEVGGMFPTCSSTRVGGNPNNPRNGVLCGPSMFSDSSGIECHDYRDSGSAARFFYCAKASKQDRDEGCEWMPPRNNMRVNAPRDNEAGKFATQLGNHHPTVKPTDLMRYLCRLITPPGGIVLDPFMGSGSTGKAALLEGFSFVGIDLEPEYVEIARRRIAAAAPLFVATTDTT